MKAPDKELVIIIMNELYATIFAYGTNDAIRILSVMQSENFTNASIPTNKNECRMMSLYILLVVQIKYDITGQVISPEEWFRMRITDYSINKSKFLDETNKIINELSLNAGFLIKA